MNFTTLEFAIFVPIIFILYWFPLKNTIKGQNILLLVASYIFYGWWDWRFLLLIVFSSTLDFVVGILLDTSQSQKKRQFYLALSLVGNLGMLGFFKYYNFFIDNVESAFSFFGYSIGSNNLQIILPIGISFYTLQTLSYTIDVYRKNTKATKDFVSFYAYVSFFPQLVAGPIERSTHFLPQFLKKRTFSFDAARDGGRQFLWGLFKKLIIANQIYAFKVLEYSQDSSPTGIKLLYFAALGSIQFYCDFSAYSDMAIGTARFFGFNLMKNFNFPFFSRNISEFWNRWHISLIIWIREYIVKTIRPRSKKQKLGMMFIVFFLTGLWHGADWNYIAWGIMNAIFLLIYTFVKKQTKVVDDKHSRIPSIRHLINMMIVFFLFAYSGVYFIAGYYNLGGFLETTKNLYTFSPLTPIDLPNNFVLFFIAVMFIVEWLQRSKEHALEDLQQYFIRPVRWVIYYSLIILICYYGESTGEFLYYQF